MTRPTASQGVNYPKNNPWHKLSCAAFVVFCLLSASNQLCALSTHEAFRPVVSFEDSLLLAHSHLTSSSINDDSLKTQSSQSGEELAADALETSEENEDILHTQQEFLSPENTSNEGVDVTSPILQCPTIDQVNVIPISSNCSHRVVFPVDVEENDIYSLQPGDPQGYNFLGQLNGHFYYVSQNVLSWHDSKAAAENAGGHLLTIGSAEEDSLTNLNGKYYMGLTDEQIEGEFRWITEEALNYENWRDGEPNNGFFSNHGGEEHYVAKESIYSNQWNDKLGTTVDVSKHILEYEYNELYVHGTKPGDVLPPGVHSFEFYVTDLQGNQSNTCVVTFDPIDAIPPTLVVNSAITLDLAISSPAILDSALAVVSVTDNCSNPTVSFSQSVFDCYSAGDIITVLVTASDDNMNTTNETVEVSIIDSSDPELICQPVTHYLDSTGIGDVPVYDVVVSAFDNCDLTYSWYNTPVHCNLGETLDVALSVNDTYGNSMSCTTTINVVDTMVPVPDVIYLPALTAQCQIYLDDYTFPTATDNCVGTVLASTTSPPTLLGSTTVLWDYTDDRGNTSTQSQEVVILDDTAPVVDQAILDTIYAQCEFDISTIIPPTATDNCMGVLNGLNDIAGVVNSDTTIMWTYADNDGNAVSQPQTVVIDDTTAPHAINASLPNIESQCQVIVSDITPPQATDNCDGTIIGTTTSVGILASNTSIVWTYTDGQGNSSTQSQTVLINDINSPTPDVVNLSPLNFECAIATSGLTVPTATDNCSGQIVATHSLSDSLFTSGTIIWSYEDAQGNISTQSQEISIADNTAPQVNTTVLDTLYSQCALLASDIIAPTANDNCAGQITATHNLADTLHSSTTIMWTYTDNENNTTTQTQEVRIVDTIAPEPNLLNLSTIVTQCSVVMNSLTPPLASDNCSGQVSGAHGLPDTLYSSTSIVWMFEDEKGNVSYQTQEVMIEDTIAPTADVLILDTLWAQCELITSTIVLPTATDNCSGPVIATHNLSDTLHVSTTIQWTYTDTEGNTSSQPQEVIIADTESPNPNALSLNDIESQCQLITNTLAVPMATDACSGQIMATHNLEDTIYTNTTILWTYTDDSDNVSTQIQEIVINDTAEPVPNYSSLDTLYGQCEFVTSTLVAPTATDNCLGQISATHTLTDTLWSSTSIVWVYTDSNGNTASQTQELLIEDNAAPNADINALDTIYSQCFVIVDDLLPPSATDNCSGLVVASHSASDTLFSNSSIVWTYADAAGNMSTQSQQVIISDDLLPTLTVVPELVLTLNNDGFAEIEASSVVVTNIDNCSGTTLHFSESTFDCTHLGDTISVSVTSIDASLNTAIDTVKIIVQDIASPNLICAQEHVVELDEMGQGMLDSTAVVLETTDNCTQQNALGSSWTNNLFDCSHLGSPQTSSLTIVDDSGNSSSCSISVTVVNPIPPQLFCPDTLFIVSDEMDATVPVTISAPQLVENCSGAIVTNNYNGLVDLELPYGVSEVTWIAENDGLEGSCTSIVSISPSFTSALNCTDSISVNNDPGDCGAELLIEEPELIGIPNSALSNNIGAIANTSYNFDIGTTSLIWSGQSIDGQTFECTTIVHVEDIEPPVILSCPSDTTHCGTTLFLNRPDVVDNCALVGEVMSSWPANDDGSMSFPSAQPTAVIFTASDGYSEVSCTTMVTSIDVDSIAVCQEDFSLEALSIATIEAQEPSRGIGTWSVSRGGSQLANADSRITEVVGLDIGTNTFLWTVETEECGTYSDELNIEIIPFSVPNGFSPNGDGINDLFTIKGMDMQVSHHFIVYNRWGQIVFEENGFQNNWNGKNSNGNTLISDTYFYTLESKGDKPTIINGFIELKR